MDPYSRRDLYNPPPPRYLRPLHRYTPRPVRVEYRSHVEYLGSSGGSPLRERCRRLLLLERLRQEYILRGKEELQNQLRFVRTPPLPRSEDGVVGGASGGAAPGGVATAGGGGGTLRRGCGGGVAPGVEPLTLCCPASPAAPPLAQAQPPPQPRRTLSHHLAAPPATAPPAPTVLPPPSIVTASTTTGIWRNAGGPPSPSPSPPSQTSSASPPSMMDSGIYSRSGPSSETPSSCSSLPPAGGGAETGGGGRVPETGQPAAGVPPAGQPSPGAAAGAHTQQPQRPALITQRSMPVTQAEHLSAASTASLLTEKLKKNTALFFGVHEESEKERSVWLDRRKRLASRRCGQLKDEFQSTTHLAVRGISTDSSKVDDTDSRFTPDVCPLRQKPSVASMTFKGVAILAAALNKQRSGEPQRRKRHSRSYTSSTYGGGSSLAHSPIDDEVFFDRPSIEEPRPPPPTDFVDTTTDILGPTPERATRDRQGSWKRSQEGRRELVTQVGLSRISGIDLDRLDDNSDRSRYGQGIVHKLFGRSLKRSVVSRDPVKEQLEDLEDHRPYFTYWLSTVQILILIISLISYGFGPFGMDLSHQSGLVLVTSLSLQQVDYTEPANFWLGPRAADLIHLGAKFAPCMRRDAKIIKEIEKGRERERETACCIRNDDSGCVQLSKADCSSQISTWKKWSGDRSDTGSGGRISGSVCGLDPKYCEAPASVAPYEWPDDITKWPICRKTMLNSPLQRVRTKDKLAAEHMVCEVIGHPCCIGIHATCKITTKEYCDFVHGTFHDEASLCSQVSCLDDVCGMFPFMNAEEPDQFYRLISSIFLHAGIVQLAISLWIQWLIMRDLEKLTGTVRLMIIYIGSGIAGNLASAIFIPYRADVGPAGSQSGLLACLIVEILNMWPMLKHPYRALFKHLAIAGFLFIIGLLPWFDNFSQFFGFLFGFLLSYAILPFISLGEYDRQKKIFIIWVCLITCGFLFLLLVLFFYVIPVYDCEFCGYLNCIPLTRDFCSAQNINFKRSDSPV